MGGTSPAMTRNKVHFAMTLPLQGLLVVSLEQAVAAPMCTCRLAAARARVVQIEPPEGGFRRPSAHVGNRGGPLFLSLQPRAVLAPAPSPQESGHSALG